VDGPAHAHLPGLSGRRDDDGEASRGLVAVGDLRDVEALAVLGGLEDGAVQAEHRESGVEFLTDDGHHADVGPHLLGDRRGHPPQRSGRIGGQEALHDHPVEQGLVLLGQARGLGGVVGHQQAAFHVPGAVGCDVLRLPLLPPGVQEVDEGAAGVLGALLRPAAGVGGDVVVSLCHRTLLAARIR